MKFSAGKAGRKWPCGGLACGEWAMVTAGAAVLVMLCAVVDPAAARKFDQGGWGDLMWRSRPRLRGSLLPTSVPLPRPRPADAPAIEAGRPADKPAAGQAEPVPAPPSACRLALTDAIAIAPSIPDIHGVGGCGGEDLVRLEAVVLPDKRRVALKPAAILRCTMASAIADWIRTDMAPLATSLGSIVSDLDNFDSFECRGRNRVVGAALSEHGKANALDVRALKMANGQSISLTDRNVPRGVRETVLHSVCARFSTVLGPGSDGYHEDHIHLDLMERRNNYKICQWNVWDPMPQIAPLLPAERPDEAPPREVAAKSDAAKGEAAKSDPGKSESAPQAVDQPAPPTKKRRKTGAF